MWFPREKYNGGRDTGFPWYNKTFFNPFNPDYNVTMYPIHPYEIIPEIEQGFDPLKVYIFYDASTSKSYLIQPITTKQVVISEITRSKKSPREDYKVYSVHLDSELKPVETGGASIWTEYADVKAIERWILERYAQPSETTNAHHAYYLVHDPQFKTLNWNYFPMEIINEYQGD